MNDPKSSKDSKVIIRHDNHMMSIVLNRPHAINSLDPEMILLIKKALDEAETSPAVRLVLLRGEGERGFCAGGDIKALMHAVVSDQIEEALQFLETEYALDLHIHRFPKPIIVLADGITMGGGLGLAAGADIVVATEQTRMAMPETRIGFFPDVGATGWMFTKCPKGYPEFLGLTGYEMLGAECVRVGLATYLVLRNKLPETITLLTRHSESLIVEKAQAVSRLHALFEVLKNDIPQNPDMDEWVRTYFAGRTSLPEILTDLSQCSVQSEQCEGVFQRLSERSPTALVLTHKLLRHNEGRPLDEVFRNDIQAARFILKHPDCVEGIRARVIDKDDNPHWQPDTIEKAASIMGNF